MADHVSQPIACLTQPVSDQQLGAPAPAIPPGRTGTPLKPAEIAQLCQAAQEFAAMLIE